MTSALALRNVSKDFPLRRSIPFGSREVIHAVDDVSLDVPTGTTLGLVGESGCGKSTVGRLATRFHVPTSGEILLHGRDLAKLRGGALRAARTGVQLVFQDPYASLDPRHQLVDIVGEPRQIAGDPRRRVAERVADLLTRVGMDPRLAGRYPHELSGGQRQRVAIARALASDASVLVLDEPVSSLDVSIQAQVVSLLQDLQADLGLTYLFISHDLSVVRHLSQRVAVMYLGRIVEEGDADAVLTSPAHPYTVALLSAVPIRHPRDRHHRRRIVLQGDVPSASNPPSGCHFRTRCWKADEVCASVVPPLDAVASDHIAACHHPEPVILTTSGGPVEPTRC
jgi:oligopeptide/dipeptide ABC transporter ATP-binding protein